MVNDILSKSLQIVLEIALPLLVASAAGWVFGKFIEIMKKIRDKNPELYEILSVVSAKAVEAAEQIFGGKEGEKKKKYAIDVITKYLKAKGITLDVEIISAYIEAAVKEMNSGYKLPEVDPFKE